MDFFWKRVEKLGFELRAIFNLKKFSFWTFLNDLRFFLTKIN